MLFISREESDRLKSNNIHKLFKNSKPAFLRRERVFALSIFPRMINYAKRHYMRQTVLNGF